MICPKCKTELPDNTIRCTKCGLKVNIKCPQCQTINTLGTLKCKNCETELIKKCPNCNSYNIPSAKNCRKCNTLLEENIEESFIQEPEIVKPLSTENNNYNFSNIPPQPVEQQEQTDNEEQVVEEKIFNVEETEIPDILAGDILETEDEETNESDSTEVMDEIEEITVEEEEIINIEAVEDIIIEVNDSIENENKQEETEEEIVENYSPKDLENIKIQIDTVNKVTNILKTSINKHIIALNGKEGTGKSAVLKQVKDNIRKDSYICLYGSCTPLLQITSFGFFQDAFLRMMGFPPFIKSSEAFLKDFKRSNFSKIFNCLDSKELALFLNIFYPNKEDCFENILDNKKTIFSILERVITSLLLSNNIVILIDNFELLDGASYDFITYLLKKGYFNNRLKLIVAYQENKSIQSYFDIPELSENIFETVIIKKFNKKDITNAVIKTIGLDIEKLLPEEYLAMLIEKSNGNAIRMEQETALLFDTNYIALENERITIKNENKPEISPETFEELVKLRLNLLSPITKNMLYMAAIMGYRFSTNILSSALNIPEDKAFGLIDFLAKELYINYVDNYTYEFKSLTLWKIIYKEAKADSLYKENSQRLYAVLKTLILSSNLQKSISCTEALSKEEEYKIWENTTKLSAKLGDTNLYVIAQKQCLKLIDEIELPESEQIKAQIYEEIGKLLYEKSPSEAVTYISNILDTYIKNADIKKVIDLSGYFIKSCYLTGNYFGVSEATDAVISAISSSDTEVSELDISLIKTRKLPALFNIGNSEQIINLVNEEIMIDLDVAIKAEQKNIQYYNLLVDSWLLSKITLAKAYAIQGNKAVFNVIEQLKAFILKHPYETEYYNTQIKLLEAFAYTTTGYIPKSEEILNNITVEYKLKKMETDLLVQWNIINVINRVFSGQTTDIKVDLFELATFANNINEHSIKNIVKLILGYVIKEENNKQKALEIFNEEIAYFAKEKIAIGAMLSWALIVQLSMSVGDYDKALNTANKSLEIAQSPKINNYFFSIYFQKYIAEIYIVKQDYTAAKMYLEKAIMIAKQYDLKYQLVELYIAYGKYLEQYMNNENAHSTENVNLTYEMYSKGLAIAKELKLKNLMERAVKDRASFKVFCQLNAIEVI